VTLLYLRQAKQYFTITLARRGVVSAIYESLRETVWLAKRTTLLVFSQTPDLSEWHFGASLDRPGRGCGCTFGTCYITRDVGSLEFKRVHKERDHHW